MRGLAILVGLVSLLQQVPSFRSGVQLLEVDARVFDKSGRFVSDLVLDDFEILEDGRSQKIETMFLVGGPAREPSTAGASSNVPRAPQTWIFVFDDRHLVPNGYRRAKMALDAFMAERFRPGDLAGIVVNDKMLGNRITAVRSEYLVTLRTMKMPGESAARERDRAEADVTGGDGEAGEGIRGALSILNAQEAERAARTTVQTLDELARGLARMPGPKTIVFFSDGFALARLEEMVRSTVGNMTRAGARVYAVDTRGLAGPPSDVLNTFSVDTGGLALFNLNNVGNALDSIAADTNTYYVLGYQPSNRRMDGKYRRIEVRVKRPNLSVRARSGYLALQPAEMMIPKAVR